MKRIMVALDCTPPSLKAMAYVAQIAPHVPGVEVVLFSIATGIHLPAEQLALPDAGAELPLEHQHEKAQIDAMHQHAESLLVRNGMDPQRVIHRVKVISRGIALDILDEANAAQIDTLAIGHRGLSKVREMLVGSVSSKILHAGAQRAIWVIE